MNDFTWKSKRDLSNPSSIIFTASLDDKGRIVIPASVRNKLCLKFNSQVLLELKKINGCDSVKTKKIDGDDGIKTSISDCGSEDLGSNPSRRLVKLRWCND